MPFEKNETKIKEDTPVDNSNDDDQGQIDMDQIEFDLDVLLGHLDRIIENLENNPEDNQAVVDNANSIKDYHEQNGALLPDHVSWIQSFVEPEIEPMPEIVLNEPNEPVYDPLDAQRHADMLAARKKKQLDREAEDPASRLKDTTQAVTAPASTTNATSTPVTEPTSQPTDDKSTADPTTSVESTDPTQVEESDPSNTDESAIPTDSPPEQTDPTTQDSSQTDDTSKTTVVPDKTGD